VQFGERNSSTKLKHNLNFNSNHETNLNPATNPNLKGRSPFSHLSHPKPNPNSYPNITLTLNFSNRNVTLTLILTLTNPNLNSNHTVAHVPPPTAQRTEDLNVYSISSCSSCQL